MISAAATMAMDAAITISLNEKQSLAVNSPAQETLYGGAAGGGKSYLLRAAGIKWCLEVPGLQVYLFRRTFPELELNHLKGSGNFHEMLAPLINAGKAKVVGKEVRFSNGSNIHLRHLQNASDLTTYQGAEFHVLLLDEATHFTEEEYRYLRGRMRLGTLKIPDEVETAFPRSILGTNPGGVGHHWCKQGFVDHGEFVVHKTQKEDGGMTRTFVPAKLEDNPAMQENDPDYESRLEGLGDKALVRSLRDGDWSVIAGAMFADVWRQHLHVCHPFDIPVDWDIWQGADDGFAAPACTYWITQDPRTKTYYVLDEIYEKRLYPDIWAERWKEKSKRIGVCDHLGEPLINRQQPQGYLDSGAFSDTGQGNSQKQEIPRGKQLNKLGIKVKPVPKWHGSRVHRCQNLHRLLAPNPDDPNGRPGIIFFSNCTNAIRTIPALGRDKKNQEDVDTDHEDHAYDAVTYALQWKKSRAGTRKTRGT